MDTQLEERIREIVREEIRAYFARVEADLPARIEQAKKDLFDFLSGQ